MADATRVPKTNEAVTKTSRAAGYPPTPADFDAIVRLSAQYGTDPHDVAAVELWESGFNPAEPDPAHTGGGLNQMDAPNLASLGIALPAWLAMTAAAQEPVIFGFWSSLAKKYAGGVFPADGAHLYALNFLPGRYWSSGAATNPNAALTSRGEAFYDDNTNLDPGNTGSITVNTIAARLTRVKAMAAYAPLAAGIDAAIARAGSGGTGGASPGPVSQTPSAPKAAPSTKANGLTLAALGLVLVVGWMLLEGDDGTEALA